MEFIDILVRELPKRGGWPEGAVECVRFVDEATIDFYDEHGNWPDDCSLTYGPIATAICITPTEPCQRESVTLVEYEAALAASKTEWDGEGLPPVGCECQYETNGYGVKIVLVECITMDGIAFTWLGEDPKFSGLDCINIAQAHRFRPILSEADKKRDEVGLALYHAINWNAEGELVSPSRMEDYKKAYDAIAAGKIPHIRID